ncbi:MAG: hypothetical protein K0R18_1414 [Bacillales bacterium]|jgi:hypothetical protein|nr:hypothetical protein [Bacillales bacterium]
MTNNCLSQTYSNLLTILISSILKLYFIQHLNTRTYIFIPDKKEIGNTNLLGVCAFVRILDHNLVIPIEILKHFICKKL